MLKKPKIIVVVGPNASGKSELGVKIAKKIDGEIISADSRQVYKKLDVGSGKVGGVWKKIGGQKKFAYKNIVHHCIDIAEPKKVFTADDYRKCAQAAIADILSRGKTPIIVGGTGFYIDAAIGRVKLGGVPPNYALRKKLSKKSTVELLKMLKKLDQKRAETIEQKNPRRLIRAIEIAVGKADAVPELILAQPALGSEASAILLRQKSETMPKWPQKPFGNSSAFPQNTMAVMLGSGFGARIEWVGIKRSPAELQKRIHARLIKRLPGIIREIKRLRQNGLSWKRLYDLGLEYRYASLYLRGKLSHLQLTQQLTSQIWHYAKRQMTWFKKNEEIHWISSQKEALYNLKRRI